MGKSFYQKNKKNAGNHLTMLWKIKDANTTRTFMVSWRLERERLLAS
jgi:hypothetical protein